MKKKIIIIIVIILIISISMGIIYFNRSKDKIVSTIILDINPSIEINLNKKNNVKSIKTINDDAKDIIDDELIGKTLDDLLNIISNKVIEKGYIDDNRVSILLYSTGEIRNEDIEIKLRDTFASKDIDTEIFIIDNITDEDKELSNKYNISISKASYINSILKDNNNVDVDNLVNKPIRDLNETKTTGNYCNEGYIIEGDWCLKEKNRVDATKGEVCPRVYYEYNDKCYEEVPIENTDKLLCREGFKLVDNKCIRNITMDAEASKYKCPSGEQTTNYKAGLSSKNDGNANDVICIDKSKATHPVSPCETHDGTEYTISGGKCYWHRAPVIESGCPGKKLVNGMCWDDASNIYICEGFRDGKRYSSRDEYCENSIKYIQPIVSEYKCPNDYKLNGKKCIKEEIEDAQYEQVCPSGYSLVNNDRCINYKKEVNKESGYKCSNDQMRLKGNMCIEYEMIEAEHS